MVVVDQAVASAAEAASKDYSRRIAAGLNSLADDIEAKRIINSEQLQSNAQARLKDAREQAFARSMHLTTKKHAASTRATRKP